MKVIDADGLIVGRMASKVAQMLMSGEEVVILNSEAALFTGSRDSVFYEFKRKRELTHKRKGPFYPRMPDKIVKRSIRGMIPYQKPSGRAAYKRLKVFIGTPDEYKKSKAKKIEEAKLQGSNKFVTVGEISTRLGSKYKVIE